MPPLRRASSISLLALLTALPGACNRNDGGEPERGAADGPATEPPPADAPPADATAAAGDPDPNPPDPIPRPPAGPHPFGVRDLVGLARLGEHRVSPDGATIVFTLRQLDYDTGKSRGDLWSVPTAGGEPTRLTDDDARESSPRFTPDGKHLLFLSTRDDTTQVWARSMADGSSHPVTQLPLPVGNLELAPTGDRIAFTAEVFVDCEDLQCTADRLDARARERSTGRVYDGVFVRHWDTWEDGRRSHLLTMPLSVDSGTPQAAGNVVDLSRGQDADVPSQPFGGSEEYGFSPDGKTVVYTARDVGASEPWSTNFDLFAVSADGSGERRNLTADNPAWDSHPVFSPDGKTLVYKAMKRPGYEADRFGLMAMQWPDGTPAPIADDWDRSTNEIAFAPDGASLLVSAQNLGQVGLFRVDLGPASRGTVTELLSDGTLSGITPVGDRIVFARHDLRRPTDLWSIPATGLPEGTEPTQLTHVNAERLADVKMGEPQQWTFAGWSGETVHAYAVEPAEYREGERYPIAFLIHGGPQGSFGNKFHYRWNAQTYAGAGYAVIMIDFHGSTGYGQAFTDSIGGDWGGKPLEDLRRGLADATGRFDWMDGDRACALGASYGGFMINWIAGQWPNRFRCLVNHDGVFDQRMMYYATEELWFPEWEHGAPPFEDPAAYERHNPVLHVGRWSTPMMVIHGSLDYRVPETQGLGAFNALQRRGVPSRYLYFPDENHWVLQAANSVQWHDEVERWLAQWLQPTAGSEGD